ncbi:MAG: efflux RND transporter periplasmic adaptor subunit [Chitinophagaceae bacterium]
MSGQIKYKGSKWMKMAMLILILIAGCKFDHPKNPKQASNHQPKLSGLVFTCPMHHQIKENGPGKCPICGMTLIPEEVKSASMDNSKSKVIKLKIPLREQDLANIQCDTAKLAPLASQIVLSGTTIFNPQHQEVVSAWVSGWIEKLYVRNPGEMVLSGQKLYDLYSPDLLSAEKDYLLFTHQKNLFKSASVDFSEAIKAMKLKLIRWGLSQSQINNLNSHPPTGRVAIFSKTSGFLTQKMKEEGDFIKQGDVVLNIAQNQTLWVQAELFDNEIPLINDHPKIWVELDALPGEKIEGKMVFNNPALNKNSRILLVNIEIPNPKGQLQPGMLAYVHLQTGGKKPGILIPQSAIIYDPMQNYVWIKQTDGSFEMRGVKLGNNNSTLVEITKGVKPGELVVSHGTYLLNSQYILEYGSGVNMAGMQMSDMKMSGQAK